MLKLSLRAQDILKNPKFAKGEAGSSFWEWTISLQGGGGPFLEDKITELTYLTPSPAFSLKEGEALFLETLSRLSLGRSIEALNRLTFREVENFLRDENHQVAFLQTEEGPLVESFNQVKNSLLTSLLKNKLQENDLLNSAIMRDFLDWETLSFVEKNRQVSQFIMGMNLLFPNEKSLQLLLVEGGLVNVKLNEFPLPQEVLESALNDFFLTSVGKTSLKVVAAL